MLLPGAGLLSLTHQTRRELALSKCFRATLSATCSSWGRTQTLAKVTWKSTTQELIHLIPTRDGEYSRCNTAPNVKYTGQKESYSSHDVSFAPEEES